MASKFNSGIQGNVWQALRTATFSISFLFYFFFLAIIYVQHLAHIKTISAQLKRTKNPSKMKQNAKRKRKNDNDYAR